MSHNTGLFEAKVREDSAIVNVTAGFGQDFHKHVWTLVQPDTLEDIQRNPYLITRPYTGNEFELVDADGAPVEDIPEPETPTVPPLGGFREYTEQELMTFNKVQLQEFCAERHLPAGDELTKAQLRDSLLTFQKGLVKA